MYEDAPRILPQPPLDDLISRVGDGRLFRQALQETAPLVLSGAGRQQGAVPGRPSTAGPLARGWARRPRPIPSTAGVRFVDRQLWGRPDQVALGRARPSGVSGSGQGGDEQIVTFVLRLATSEEIEDSGEIRVLSRFGGVSFVQATAEGVQQLRDRLGASAVSMARPLVACQGGSAPAGLGMIHANAGFTGEGVLIGIADFRIDFHHSNLRNPDGSTRIAALWDQEATFSGVGQVGPRGIGVVYSAADIDQELSSGAPPFQHVAHNWMVGDGTSLQEVHGTHVAAMAVGTGVSRVVPHTGAAPGARLLFVNLRPELQMLAQGARFDFAMEDAILAAVEWMDDTAWKGRHGVPAGSPLVISVSLADYTGPRDGTGLSVDLAQALAGRDNRALLMAAGNGNDISVHARIELEPGVVTQLQVEYADDAATSDLIEIFSPEAPLDVAVHSPDFGLGPSIVSVHSGGQVEGFAPGPNGDQVKVQLVAPATPVTQVNDYRVRLKLVGQPGISRPLRGVWTIAVRSGGAAPVTADIYGSIANEGRRILIPASTGSYTVSDLASSPEVITVGAHLVPLGSPSRRPVWSESGRGPTRAGVIKPDLATEGANLRSCQPRGRWRVQDKALHQELVRTGYLSGTSLATPVAAGALACRMQQLGLTDGRSMTMAEIHDDFRGLVSLESATLEDGSRDPVGLQRAFGLGCLDPSKLLGGVGSTT